MAGQYSARALAHGWLKHEILSSGYVTRVDRTKDSYSILELSGQMKEVPPKRAVDRSSVSLMDKTLQPIIPMVLKLTITIDGVRKTLDYRVFRWDCENERVQISTIPQPVLHAIAQSFDPKFKKKMVTYRICQNRTDAYKLEKDDAELAASAAMRDVSAPAVRRSDFAWEKGRAEEPQKVVAAPEEVREDNKWYACVAKRRAAAAPKASKKGRAKKPEKAKRPEMAWPEVEGGIGKAARREGAARKISVKGVRGVPTTRGDAGFEISYTTTL